MDLPFAQTMNYVGQLAGQVFVTVKELYKGLNPATLSGCIDIIVVRQPNGNLQCSPFHVRFGKMGVLRSREKVVDIEINGESVDLHMKLGDNGEAFFVQETDSGQEAIPLHLATSPILSEGASRMEAQLKRGALERGRGLEPGSASQAQAAGELLSAGLAVKKRRKRRRKCQLDSLKRDDGLHTSEDEDLFPIEMSSDEDLEPPLDRALVHDVPAFRDEAPQEGPSAAPAFLPSPCYSSSDREWALPQSQPLDCKRLSPHMAVVAEGGLSNSCPPQSSHFPSSDRRPKGNPKRDGRWAHAGTRSGLPRVHWAPAGGSGSSGGAMTASVLSDKRNRHLGSDGVYLDDLPDMDPEVAALYFPKNGDGGPTAKSGGEGGPRSASQSPQSVGSSGVDSGVESTSDGPRDLPSIAISLCGGLGESKEVTTDEFLEQEVTYQQFVDNPAIIDDPNLVVKIGSKYYNWTTAAPLLLAMQAFQKPLPKATVESIVRDKMPRKGGRWWFSWRGRNTVKEESKPEQCLAGTGLVIGEQPAKLSIGTRMKEESSSSDEDALAAKQSGSGLHPLMANVGYKKTLRLTSDQLVSLPLLPGQLSRNGAGLP
uniref:Lipin 1 n=1 Tax=Monodelphis domestica TaxID=13616 RepID=F7A6W0_MONDO